MTIRVVWAWLATLRPSQQRVSAPRARVAKVLSHTFTTFALSQRDRETKLFVGCRHYLEELHRVDGAARCFDAALIARLALELGGAVDEVAIVADCLVLNVNLQFFVGRFELAQRCVFRRMQLVEEVKDADVNVGFFDGKTTSRVVDLIDSCSYKEFVTGGEHSFEFFVVMVSLFPRLVDAFDSV